MTKIEQIMEGLKVIQSYGGEDADAQHDEIFAGGGTAKPSEMADSDVGRMEACDWRWDEENESWAIFT